MTGLDETFAAQLAQIALGHVRREYPNHLAQVLTGPRDLAAPRALHPVFFGSLDWHSSVHSHWLLARVLRQFPEGPHAAAIRRRFDEAFTAPGVTGEADYFARPTARLFERPYGWAWLLMLVAELGRGETQEMRRWAATLQPLASLIASRFAEWLPRADYPVRSGVHSNTAFALALALEYADAGRDPEFAATIREKALSWHFADIDCQAWEPSGEDFLSPALMEAELMRRVLGADAFRPWLAAFLPRVAQGEPESLFIPAEVADRSDGRIAHLDGLNLSRAWCWRGIASALEGGNPLRKRALAAARRHLDASLPHLADDYMGEHWLASFALLALSDGSEPK